MHYRRNSGASLALVVGCLGLLIVLGVGFFFLSQILGGEKELQNAVDSGNLNVAKRSLREVTVELNPGIEKENFNQFVERNGEVSLFQYNRAVGRALFIADRAQGIQNPQAAENAVALLDAVQAKKGSLGSRLLTKLKDKNGPGTQWFNDFATSNSLRMLGKKSAITYNPEQYDIGYIGRGSSTNKTAASSIAVNPQESQFLGQFASEVEVPNRPGFFYLRGYEDITFFPDTKNERKIQAVTSNPGQRPHLTSIRNFKSNQQSPDPEEMVPANAFKTVAAANVEGVEQAVVNEAVSVVGSVVGDVGSPGGDLFVRVNNPEGFHLGDQNGTATVENVVNNEMFGNIWITDNDLFSTDRARLEQWVQYNNDQTLPRPSNVEIFNQQGGPAQSIELEKITGLGSSSYSEAPLSGQPCLSCTFENLSGAGKIQRCADMLPVFNSAYGYDLDGSLKGDQLIAVEKAKADLIAVYYTSWGQDGGCREVKEIALTAKIDPETGLPRRFTGLRKFDHEQIYIAYPEGNPWNPNWSRETVTRTAGVIKFSKPATIREYLQQVGVANAGANQGKDAEKEVIEELRKNLNEIKANLSDEEFDELIGFEDESKNVNSPNKLELGKTYYIYLDQNPINPKLILTQDPPPFAPNAADLEPDGDKSKFSTKYEIVGNIVNPVHEIGIHYMLFTQVYQCGTEGQNPRPTGYTLHGVDDAIWTTSTGFNHLLGEIEFRNRGKGCADFCSPN